MWRVDTQRFSMWKYCAIFGLEAMSPTPTARPATATTRNKTIRNWTSSCHIILLVAPMCPPKKLLQSSRACRTESTPLESSRPTREAREALRDLRHAEPHAHLAEAQNSHRFEGLHLIRLDFRVADHLTPLLEIVLDELGELLGRAGIRHQSLARELLAHLLQRDDRADLRVVFRDEVRGHSRGGPHADPQVHVIAGHALLMQRGNVGKQGMALLQALAEHLDLARLDLRERNVHGEEHGGNDAGDQVVLGLRRTLVGHVHHVPARPPLEQLPAQRMGRARSGGAAVELARLRPPPADELPRPGHRPRPCDP